MGNFQLIYLYVVITQSFGAFNVATKYFQYICWIDRDRNRERDCKWERENIGMTT